MALCDDIVEHVATLLNDMFPGHAFTRWSRELIECAHNEAIGLLASLQPDAFVEIIKHKLEPGYVQTAPEECGTVVAILGQADEAGNVMSPMTPSDTAIARWFTESCADFANYEISSANVDPKSANTFFVNPPVPYGADVTVLLQCAGGCGDGYKDRCSNKTAIIEFMMYRLLGADETSPASAAAATAHLQTFFNVTGLTLQARNAIRRGQNVPTTAPQG